MAISKDSRIGLILALYHKARSSPYDLYFNHMRGIEILKAWLEPPPYIDLRNPIPWYKSNYEIQRLSIILSIREQDIIDFFISLDQEIFD